VLGLDRRRNAEYLQGASTWVPECVLAVTDSVASAIPSGKSRGSTPAKVPSRRAPDAWSYAVIVGG
jgi:hypothetical protein